MPGLGYAGGIAVRHRLARRLPPGGGRGAGTRCWPSRPLPNGPWRAASGEGGDTTLAVDLAAEDAVFAELEALRYAAHGGVRGARRGGDRRGRAVRVVIDPVDGSLNAKRGLPFACVSIAVASGERMADVELGVVTELDSGTSGGQSWSRRLAARRAASGGPRRLSRLAPGGRPARDPRPRDRAPGAVSPPASRRSPSSRHAACACSARWRCRSAWWPRAASTRCSPCERSARWTWRPRS